MFVDSDVELTEGCIGTMVAELEENGWAAIQARVLSREVTRYWQDPSYLFNVTPNDSHAEPREYVATAASLFRRDVLLHANFDPDFVEACEDSDVSWRLVREGHLLGISTAVAFHQCHCTFPTLIGQQIEWGRGYARLARKHGLLRFVFGPIANPSSNLMRSLATGKWNHVSYFLSIAAGRLIGAATLRPKQVKTIKLNTA
jgi:GT2 family glycosyltransferase